MDLSSAEKYPISIPSKYVSLATEQINEGHVHDLFPNQHIYFKADNSVHLYTSQPCAVDSDVDDLEIEVDDELISDVVPHDREAWTTVTKKQK